VKREIYKERAATSETVNADLRCYRGLTQTTVRGLPKIKCVILWCALAYNVMHFGAALLKTASCDKEQPPGEPARPDTDASHCPVAVF
jgi:hypothetical protein